MEMKSIYRKVSYLLEDEIVGLNEAAINDILSVVKEYGDSDFTKSIEQSKNNQSQILSKLKMYTKDKIGQQAKTIDDALNILKENPIEQKQQMLDILKKIDPHYQETTTIAMKKAIKEAAKRNNIEDSEYKPIQDVITLLSNKIMSAGRNIHQKTTSAAPQNEPFPGNKQLFLQSYKRTLDAGWPGEPVVVKKVKKEDGKIEDGIESPVTGKLIPIDAGASINQKITDLIAPAKVKQHWIKEAEELVYNKFKNNVPGLKKLSELVKTINEKNKQYKISRRVNVRNLITSIGHAFLARFGATDSDRAIFDWLVKTAVNKDIFEFQEIVIDSVMSRLDISDDRLQKMEKIANGIRTLMGNLKDKFEVSPLKSEQSSDTYVVSYTIKSLEKPNNTPQAVTAPMKFFLEQMLEYNKKTGKKTWTETPSDEDIRTQLLKIADYAGGKVKTPYTYETNEDGILSYVETEEDNGKLIGTQYMYPVFLNRSGLKIVVKYRTPERD